MKERIKAWDYQSEIADIALPILRENGIVYLSMEERTGKSLIGVLCAEESTISKVLIITKKKAMEGWDELINNYIHLCSYTVINYHSLHKIDGDYDLIIVDEPHAYISGYPKTSKTWKMTHKFCKGKPLIYMSATSHAQGTQLLYHQFKLSDWSPWAKFKDFYAWYQHYAERDKAGHVKTIYIGPNRTAVDYTAVDHDRIWNDVKHLFITKTRKELGFKQEPNDIIHFIELDQQTKDVYNALMQDLVLEFTHSETGKDYILSCDSPIKLRWALHMIEGGGLKYTSSKKNKKGKIVPHAEYLVLGNREKVDYILNEWGDSKELVIMHQYKSDLAKLEREFENALILQATSFAEGVDLSMYKHLVVYSQDFSTSKHTQRRARQANKLREEDINVHFLLVKKAVSEQVYKTVSINKVNFVDSTYEREEL